MQIMVFEDYIELIPEREISTMRGFLKGINTEFKKTFLFFYVIG